MRQDLTWYGSHSAIDESRVLEVEEELGVSFPRDFAQYIVLHHGGSPRQSDFSYADPRIGHVNSCLAELLSFDPEYADNIVLTVNDLADQLPTGVTPFGATGFGDYVCFDFRQDSVSPRVAYWCHEKPTGESVIPLAATFSEFLDLLRPPADEE